MSGARKASFKSECACLRSWAQSGRMRQGLERTGFYPLRSFRFAFGRRNQSLIVLALQRGFAMKPIAKRDERAIVLASRAIHQVPALISPRHDGKRRNK